MSSFFKGVALLVALCCLVWVGMLWHWQTSQHDMSVRDVVVYLGALPLTLFALVLLGGWAWRGAAAKAELQAKPAQAAAAAAHAPTEDEAARHATWQLLAAHGNTVMGTTPAEWSEAAAAQKPLPAIDPELRDAQGLPVITARVPGVDAAAVDDEVDALLQALQPQHPELQLSQAFRRALALLRDPLGAAVAALAPWADALQVAPPKPQPGAPRAAAGPAAPVLADSRIGRIDVLAAWPAALNALELALAEQWLMNQCAAAGEGIVATARWSLVPAPGGAAADTATKALSGPQWWQSADAWFERQRRDQTQAALLLVATHSDIDADALDRLQSAAPIFSSSQPKGTVPGEAAVALLLAPAAWPRDPQAEADVQLPHLHRAAVALRDKSIDAPGRHSHALTPQLMAQALAAARLTQDDIGAVVNDADQHTARGAELFGALQSELPQLDPVEDMRMVGSLCGDIGACATLLTVALAAHQATKLDKPCLALSLRDAHWRAALVARPAAPPAPAALVVPAAPGASPPTGSV